MNLGSVVKVVAARLDAEFQGTGEISHQGSKGRVREALLMSHVLQRILPETVGIAHGVEIVCSDGTTSGECDLVVYDRDLPALYRAEGFSVLPIETVLGVIEVKSFLNKRELNSSIENVHRIKTMQRTALKRDESDQRRVRRYGKEWDTTPVSAHIVGFDSIFLRTLANHLAVAELGRPRWECLDSVYVLEKGCLSDAMSSPQRLIVESDSRERVILGMAIEFINLFQRGWQPRFDPGPYLGEEEIVGTVSGVFGSWTPDGLAAADTHPVNAARRLLNK